MTTDTKATQYVRVKDGAGNAFVCPIDVLRHPKDLTAEEIEECVDDATIGRYAGNIDIVDP
ncbi:MAG: hypothetical protein WBG37_15950 [Desulfobacterales bacterium]